MRILSTFLPLSVFLFGLSFFRWFSSFWGLSMRRVRFRKNTIFRLYLAGLFCSCLACSWFALVFQARYHASQVSGLSGRISELEARLILQSDSSSPSSPSVPSVRVETPIEKALRRESDRLFWVEGHGYNKRYAYLDLEFKDGYRARYYFKPFPSRGELISLHRRIEHDAIAHYWDPSLDLDEDEI